MRNLSVFYVWLWRPYLVVPVVGCSQYVVCHCGPVAVCTGDLWAHGCVACSLLTTHRLAPLSHSQGGEVPRTGSPRQGIVTSSIVANDPSVSAKGEKFLGQAVLDSALSPAALWSMTPVSVSQQDWILGQAVSQGIVTSSTVANDPSVSVNRMTPVSQPTWVGSWPFLGQAVRVRALSLAALWLMTPVSQPTWVGSLDRQSDWGHCH